MMTVVTVVMISASGVSYGCVPLPDCMVNMMNEHAKIQVASSQLITASRVPADGKRQKWLESLREMLGVLSR